MLEEVLVLEQRLVRFVKDRVGTPFVDPLRRTPSHLWTCEGPYNRHLRREEVTRLKDATRDACTAMTELRKFARWMCTQVSVIDRIDIPRIGEAGDAEHLLHYGKALRVAVWCIADLIVPAYSVGPELWLLLGVPNPPPPPPYEVD